MQALTAPPRASLTSAQVTSLLTGPALQTSAGLELLNPDLSFAVDISNDLVAGTVDRAMDATIHGTCKLDISQALPWGTSLVRPYMTLTGSGVTARFNLGVFSLATPELVVAETPQTFSCQGYDRLYLLGREVGDTYQVAAGTGYLDAVGAAITAAGLTGVLLDGTAQAKVLPVAMVWPLISQGSSPTKWLNIVNDLLVAIGYRGLYADENGIFRSEPYQNPSVRAVEFPFDTGAATIIGEQRTYVQDTWAVPNRWRFIQQNRDPAAAAAAEGAGFYTVDNLNVGITSQNSRGLRWPKTVLLDAADQASLVSQGDIIVAADKRVAASLKVTTGPFPLAGHRDVFSYTDPALGTFKVQATHWSQDLLGADAQWDWSVVA